MTENKALCAKVKELELEREKHVVNLQKSSSTLSELKSMNNL